MHAGICCTVQTECEVISLYGQFLSEMTDEKLLGLSESGLLFETSQDSEAHTIQYALLVQHR